MLALALIRNARSEASLWCEWDVTSPLRRTGTAGLGRVHVPTVVPLLVIKAPQYLDDAVGSAGHLRDFERVSHVRRRPPDMWRGCAGGRGQGEQPRS